MISFPKKTIEKMIDDYTRESGVRQLDKQIAKTMRVIAKQLAFDEKIEKQLTADRIREILGNPKFSKE